ncbi:VRR-NUC domain-containing protein [Burkholderia thailandensis]|uniref:VRR-NUC domain-containing protein n=1 Tax=Burkholderia thailandensis TaxID=57975 RepID=UPI0022AC3388|nr:VRR-NUC domain-containing protein [Burkholderia thailandensis]MCZ2900400.1 VRR-NUC domain-containing protein [Burkholderia thailandensis]MDD1480252.1 nuclease [Burkholderia thailandensis]MDD1487408.1 nuclease [Burkholderia thailandensis]MDD1496660.1 nuclease [Burkholderia thailandensis]
MSGYSGGTAAGGMRTGDGQTTVVGAKSGMSAEDRKVLCSLMCKCGRIGVATRGGTRILRQKCVAQRLNFANETSRVLTGKPTEYVPEVAYDMSPKPPAPPVPIMSDDDPLTPHNSLLDWIRDKWPGGIGGYVKGKKAGLDQVRRPDVVIVNDPSQPPVQSNIKAVVEMKFDDDFGKGQELAYKRIAGSDSKYAAVERADCGCGDEEPQAKPAQSAQTHSEAEDVFGDNAGGTARSGPFGMPPLPPGVPGIAFP